jgi:hypothetical protein
VNYADEATRFLDEANEAETAARWRSDELLEEAHDTKTREFPAARGLKLLIALEHDRLKEKDREYKQYIGKNQWMLQKAIASGILALVHQHSPEQEKQ